MPATAYCSLSRSPPGPWPGHCSSVQFICYCCSYFTCSLYYVYLMLLATGPNKVFLIHWFRLLGVPPFLDVLPYNSSATPTNASLYCLHSPSTVPFSASNSSYFLLTPWWHHYWVDIYLRNMVVVEPTDTFTTRVLGVCKLTRRPISNQNACTQRGEISCCPIGVL